MARLVSVGESDSGLGRVERTGLVLASQSHLEVDGRDKWIMDNEAIDMFTGEPRNLLNLKPVPLVESAYRLVEAIS